MGLIPSLYTILSQGPRSIGLMWWLLAREVLQLRGTITREMGFVLDGKAIMPDLYFFRDPQEQEKEEPTEMREKEPWAGGQEEVSLLRDNKQPKNLTKVALFFYLPCQLKWLTVDFSAKFFNPAWNPPIPKFWVRYCSTRR